MSVSRLDRGADPVLYFPAVDPERRFAELADVIGFGAPERALLEQVRPLVEAGFGAMTDDLLQVLVAHAPMAPLLNGHQDEEGRQRLLRWVEEIFGGTYDQQWTQRRASLGRHLRRASLPLGELVAATAALRVRAEDLLRHATVRAGWSDHEQQRAMVALDEILDLELALILEGYADAG